MGKRCSTSARTTTWGWPTTRRSWQPPKKPPTRWAWARRPSARIAGTTGLHLELEKRLAAFKGVEAAITFQSGFTANLATIPALVGKEDAIFSDRLNHASIIDGCRLSGAKIIPYDHCDVASLESVIKENLSQLPARHHHHRRGLQHGR